MPRTNILAGAVWLFTAAAIFAGCENSIEPLAEDANSFVFLNGFLDTATDSQFVRLEGLRPTILAAPRDLSGVDVLTVDRTSGEIVVWKDSLVVLKDGSDGHLYMGLFTPQEGHDYEFVVRRPGLEAATATTTIPDEPEIQVSTPTGDTIVFTQKASLRDVFSAPSTLAMRYDVSIPETGEIQTFMIDYGIEGGVAGTGWSFDVFLFRDQQIISFSLGLPTNVASLALRRIAAGVVINSAEWNRQENPTNLALAQGFFGSVGRFELGWKLDPSDVFKMGFLDEQDLWMGAKQDLFRRKTVLLAVPRQ